MSIQLQIGANVDGAISGINLLESQLERLQKIASLPGLNFRQQERLNELLRKTQTEIVSFRKGVDLTNPSLNKLSVTTNSATFALTNVGRVAQDLPYGFLGVANNITPLIESLRQTSVAAKQAGVSLGSALLQSLKGGGGLILGFSLLTAGVQLATSGFMNFGRKAGSAKKDADDLSGSLKLVETDADRLAKSIEEISKALTQEGLKFQFLADALNTANLSTETRKQAIDELVRSYSPYLENLNKEKQTYDAITDSINQSIITLARSVEIKALLPQVESLLQRAVKAQVELNKLNRLGFEKKGEINILLPDEEQFNKEKATFEGIIRGASNEIRHAKKFLAEIAGGQDSLIEILFGKNVSVPAAKVKVDKVTVTAGDIEIANKGKEAEIELPVRGVLREGGAGNTGGERGKASTDTADELISKYKKLADTIAGVVTPAFQGMFDAIFTGGDVMKSFFKGLIDGVNQLINRLIAAAIEALILSALTGGSTSFGSALGSILGFGGKRAGGGPVSGGKAYLIGERGPELFVPNNSGSVIPNNRLEGISGSALQQEGYVATARLEGDDIVLSIFRTLKKQGNNFGRGSF